MSTQLDRYLIQQILNILAKDEKSYYFYQYFIGLIQLVSKEWSREILIKLNFQMLRIERFKELKTYFRWKANGVKFERIEVGVFQPEYPKIIEVLPALTSHLSSENAEKTKKFLEESSKGPEFIYNSSTVILNCLFPSDSAIINTCRIDLENEIQLLKDLNKLDSIQNLHLSISNSNLETFKFEKICQIFNNYKIKESTIWLRLEIVDLNFISTPSLVKLSLNSKILNGDTLNSILSVNPQLEELSLISQKEEQCSTILFSPSLITHPNLKKLRVVNFPPENYRYFVEYLAKNNTIEDLSIGAQILQRPDSLTIPYLDITNTSLTSLQVGPRYTINSIILRSWTKPSSLTSISGIEIELPKDLDFHPNIVFMGSFNERTLYQCVDIMGCQPPYLSLVSEYTISHTVEYIKKNKGLGMTIKSYDGEGELGEYFSDNKNNHMESITINVQSPSVDLIDIILHSQNQFDKITLNDSFICHLTSDHFLKLLNELDHTKEINYRIPSNFKFNQLEKSKIYSGIKQYYRSHQYPKIRFPLSNSSENNIFGSKIWKYLFKANIPK